MVVDYPSEWLELIQNVEALLIIDNKNWIFQNYFTRGGGNLVRIKLKYSCLWNKINDLPNVLRWAACIYYENMEWLLAPSA